ncbi:MAG: hypothetical protein HEQ37_15765 [Acidovorax sp.]|nr:hypothetical protein [Acidovorax sp.]
MEPCDDHAAHDGLGLAALVRSGLVSAVELAAAALPQSLGSPWPRGHATAGPQRRRAGLCHPDRCRDGGWSGRAAAGAGPAPACRRRGASTAAPGLLGWRFTATDDAAAGRTLQRAARALAPFSG